MKNSEWVIQATMSVSGGKGWVKRERIKNGHQERELLHIIW